MDTMHNIAARCAFTSAALATLGVDPAWDKRMAAYLRLGSLQQAHASFGPLAQANEASAVKHCELEQRFGPHWKSNTKAWTEAQPLYAAALEIETQWTEQLCEPFWQAARDLVLTPAPTLAAALFKVRLIEWEDLDNDGAMTRDCFEIVAEDIERLSGGRV